MFSSYTKKIESSVKAVQWGGYFAQAREIVNTIKRAGHHAKVVDPFCGRRLRIALDSPHGMVYANQGDYILQDALGDFYVESESSFNSLYKRAL